MSSPVRTYHRELVRLPVGYEDNSTGELVKEVEVRAITGADELFVGKSPEYNEHPNDLVFKTLLLSRTIVRIGEKTLITLNEVQRLHAQDLRVLEEAVFRLTYGSEVTRRVGCPSCGHEFEADVGGPSG